MKIALKKTSRINSIFFYYIAGGSISVLSVLQSFVEESVSSWCFFTSGEILYGILLRMPPATFSTVYQWKGVFVPVEVNNCLQKNQACYLIKNLSLNFIFYSSLRISVCGIQRAVCLSKSVPLPTLWLLMREPGRELPTTVCMHSCLDTDCWR